MVYNSLSRKIFVIFNYTLFILIAISIIVPFINVVAISLSNNTGIMQGGISLWPQGFTVEGYKKLMSNSQFLRTFLNSVFLTAVNTFLVISISLAAAYVLANKHMIGKSTLFYYIIIPMFFSGGLIPSYLLVQKLGLNDTYFALILPNIISVFYIIVFKNTIDQLPKELLESAEIDGASEPLILVKIIIPLIMPMTMAFVVFSAVNYWNEWFGVLLYIKDKSMWTLQYQLRSIIVNTGAIDSQTQIAISQGGERINPENLKMSALMITVLPIIAVYPFVQKYFIHGQLVGAVKG
jgi:putative aldouronate transport system permease protein